MSSHSPASLSTVDAKLIAVVPMSVESVPIWTGSLKVSVAPSSWVVLMRVEPSALVVAAIHIIPAFVMEDGEATYEEDEESLTDAWPGAAHAAAALPVHETRERVSRDAAAPAARPDTTVACVPSRANVAFSFTRAVT